MSAEPFDYESALWGSERLRPGERSIAGFRLEEAMRWLPARGRVLEVGCGAGRFLRALRLARPGLELVGCDVSRSALDRLARSGAGVETRLAEVGAPLPAADAEFQAVWALDVLEHLERPDRLLAEAARVLGPGGVLHLHVPCEGDPLSPWRWLPGQGGLKRRFGGHLQRFRRREVLARLERAGFAILRVRHSLHLVGAAADVAAFGLLALRARRGPPGTTGDLVAGREGGGVGAPLLRALDALLWCEAKLLGQVPSWALHVSARKAV